MKQREKAKYTAKEILEKLLYAERAVEGFDAVPRTCKSYFSCRNACENLAHVYGILHILLCKVAHRRADNRHHLDMLRELANEVRTDEIIAFVSVSRHHMLSMLFRDFDFGGDSCYPQEDVVSSL